MSFHPETCCHFDGKVVQVTKANKEPNVNGSDATKLKEKPKLETKIQCEKCNDDPHTNCDFCNATPSPETKSSEGITDVSAEAGTLMLRYKEAVAAEGIMREQHFQLAYSLGKFYGYPECCIKEFCKNIFHDEDSHTRNIDGSGFVPCTEHYEKIKKEEITLDSLVDKNSLYYKSTMEEYASTRIAELEAENSSLWDSLNIANATLNEREQLSQEPNEVIRQTLIGIRHENEVLHHRSENESVKYGTAQSINAINKVLELLKAAKEDIIQETKACPECQSERTTDEGEIMVCESCLHSWEKIKDNSPE